MLKKRIIPCLDVKNGRTVKGIQFENLKDAGNPVALAKFYAEQGADELVFLDITATHEKRKTILQLVNQVAANINIPFTVGGGISTVEDARNLVFAGADKISLNSSAVQRPTLISNIASALGSQCVVVAIDAKAIDASYNVFINGGRISTTLNAIEWAKEAEKLGAGELLVTSMDDDGCKNGFAIRLLQQITNAVNIPVIASGGAGTMQHFVEVFLQTKVTAALAASVFHFDEIRIKDLKNYLLQYKIDTRC